METIVYDIPPLPVELFADGKLTPLGQAVLDGILEGQEPPSNEASLTNSQEGAIITGNGKSGVASTRLYAKRAFLFKTRQALAF